MILQCYNVDRGLRTISMELLEGRSYDTAKSWCGSEPAKVPASAESGPSRGEAPARAVQRTALLQHNTIPYLSESRGLRSER